MIINNPVQQTKVLIVEDNLIASKTAQLFLEAKGCSVDCVTTGTEAISKVGEDYDLILLDLGLPDMHGFEVAKIIRNSESKLASTRIVIVTAFDTNNNKELLNQLKISHCIVKPLSLKKCELILEANIKDICHSV